MMQWRVDHHQYDHHDHNQHCDDAVGEVAGRGCSTKEKMYYVHCEVSIVIIMVMNMMNLMIMMMMMNLMMMMAMAGS